MPLTLAQTWKLPVPGEHIAVWQVTAGDPPQPTTAAAPTSDSAHNEMTSFMTESS